MDASLISLDAAARDGAIDVVRSFLAKTGNRERSKLGTALLSAAFHGRTDIAKLLIEEGADVSYSDAEGSQCPLCLAAFGGHVEICKILVEAGAWMDWQKPDGGTALISAAFKGNVDVAEVLLQAGAFVNLATNEKRTPLHFACYDGAVELVGLLLRYGADVNVIEIQNGFSPIHTACYRGFPRAVQLLLEYGADACLKTSVSILIVLRLITDLVVTNFYRKAVPALPLQKRQRTKPVSRQLKIGKCNMPYRWIW
eukprot:m.8179 g.8179  ORF g.8179 m.8179 type:complete len:255 (+) comp20397_c0_seq2:122-886(+)